MTPVEIHNRDVGGIVKAIIKPTLDAGGSYSDVMVILESVIAGVLLFGIKHEGREPVLDLLIQHVRDDLLVELRRNRENN